MKSGSRGDDCISIESMTTFALGSLPSADADAFAIHLNECCHCQREFDALKPLAAALPVWPIDVLEPAASLWNRLAAKLPLEAGVSPLRSPEKRDDSPWEEVGPGIFCRVLATDLDTDRVSLLVRLQAGVDYPAHEHADLEELHLLEGELWINDRKLVAGDYNRAEAGSADRRVWSETGCTCVLITSMRDRLIDKLAP